MRRMALLFLLIIVVSPVMAQESDKPLESDDELESVMQELEEDLSGPVVPQQLPVIPQRVSPIARRATRIQRSLEASQKATQPLVNLEHTRAISRVEDLTRRMVEIERQMQYQDDRVRSLDREVTELRRRVKT